MQSLPLVKTLSLWLSCKCPECPKDLKAWPKHWMGLPPKSGISFPDSKNSNSPPIFLIINSVTDFCRCPTMRLNVKLFVGLRSSHWKTAGRFLLPTHWVWTQLPLEAKLNSMSIRAFTAAWGCGAEKGPLGEMGGRRECRSNSVRVFSAARAAWAEREHTEQESQHVWNIAL